MASIALIGVPSQSGGRPAGVARGVGALRAAGLVWALGEVGHVILDQGDVSLPPPVPGRDPVSEIVDFPIQALRALDDREERTA